MTPIEREAFNAMKRALTLTLVLDNVDDLQDTRNSCNAALKLANAITPLRSKRPVVIITVEGGAVQDVLCSDTTRVILADWDNIKAGEKVCDYPVSQINEIELAPEIQECLKGVAPTAK